MVEVEGHLQIRRIACFENALAHVADVLAAGVGVLLTDLDREINGLTVFLGGPDNHQAIPLSNSSRGLDHFEGNGVVEPFGRLYFAHQDGLGVLVALCQIYGVDAIECSRHISLYFVAHFIVVRRVSLVGSDTSQGDIYMIEGDVPPILGGESLPHKVFAVGLELQCACPLLGGDWGYTVEHQSSNQKRN